MASLLHLICLSFLPSFLPTPWIDFCKVYLHDPILRQYAEIRAKIKADEEAVLEAKKRKKALKALASDGKLKKKESKSEMK